MEFIRPHHQGVVIKEAREAAHMTQEQLAERWPKADGGVEVVLLLSNRCRGKLC